MQLKVGTYAFPVNGVQVTSTTMPKMSEAQIPVGYTFRLTAVGYLEGSGQNDLTTKQLLMEAALRIPFRDIVFYQDSGAESATKLKNAGSLSGVLIDRGPDFTGLEGAEYCNQRKFSFSGTVEFPILNPGTRLLRWTESLTFSGGGPIYTFKLAINGLPQKQMIYPFSPFVVTQEGSAAGYLAYPNHPAPIFGTGNLMHSPTIKKTGPKRLGAGYTEFGVSWSYEFQSVLPMIGLPTLWVG